MLHIITENKELRNRFFPIPDGIKSILVKTLNNYNGDKTLQGYKRLNNLVNSDSISYLDMKRIKNFFDNYKGTDKSNEYILNGGDAMKTWVNNTLYSATKAIEDFKYAKKEAGIDNAFKKPHDKDRQTKKTNHPTQTKFNTNDITKNISNNNAISFKESVERTITITEQQQKLLKEAQDNTFSLEELSRINSYKGRYNYCLKHLGFCIGKGSSRAVFQIDDEKILKLAINEKGVAQNDVEIRNGRDYYCNSLFPQVFQSDDNNLWVISEYVLPAKAQDFKHCFGITFKEFADFIRACKKYSNETRTWCEMSEEKLIELVDNNEDLSDFYQYICNYNPPIGDMTAIRNFGMTNRYGQPSIVLLDSGLDDYVLDNYYS